MKRTLLVTIIAFLVLVPIVSATVVPTLMDEYPIVFQDGILTLRDEHPAGVGDTSAYGQSFTATSSTFLTSASFSLSKEANPTQNATAALYAHAGNFGTTGVPTGNALALSNEFAVSQLDGNSTMWTFDFSYDQQFQLTSGTNYFIVYRNPTTFGIDNANYVEIGRDNNGGHAGNAARFTNGAWVLAATEDAIFTVYTAPQPYVAQDTLQFESNIFRWINATVRNGTGIAGFATVDLTVNTTGDAESFTFRWTQATGVFSETADTNFTGVIDTVRSRTTVIDTNTSIIHYRFKMDNATTGDCDVLINGTNDAAGFLEFLQLNEFNYAGISWTAVGDAIDSAAEFFGIFGFLEEISRIVTSFGTRFTISVTNMLLMVEQQLRLVLQIFGAFVGVFTRITGTLLTVWGFLYGIISGTGIIVTGVGNVWDFIAFDLWVDFFYIAILIWWITSIERRGRTQGEFNVFLGDVQTAINLSSYFISVFSFIVNEVVSKVLILAERVSAVIPI